MFKHLFIALSLICISLSQTQAGLFFTSTKIKRDETVVFFPGLAYKSLDGRQWIVEIHGWIFESTLANYIKKLAPKFLHLKNSPNNLAAKKRMEERIHWFFVDNERNKKLSIRLAGTVYTLRKSKPNGHFYGTFRLPVAQVARWKLDAYNRIGFAAVMQKNDPRLFKGTIQFIPDRGISIISDIDDTIKLSEVHNKHRLLRNTFLQPYRIIPGMNSSYRRWARRSQRHRKLTFHYLTASPWQLYVPLQRFIRKNHFPPGTFHMRYFRIKDRTFFNLFKSPTSYKTVEIIKLLKKFPHRQFVLIGDSGESDLEVYTQIASQYPKRIRAIFIHEVKPRPIAKNRFRSSIVRKMRSPIIIFKTYKQPAKLPFY